MEHETAGDPITGLKWTRRTTRKISEQLGYVGLNVSPRTVARLLKNVGFSLRVNHKSLSTTLSKDRDRQFRKIQKQRSGMCPESRGIWRALPSRWLSDADHSAASAGCSDHHRVSMPAHQEAFFISSAALSSARC